MYATTGSLINSLSICFGDILCTDEGVKEIREAFGKKYSTKGQAPRVTVLAKKIECKQTIIHELKKCPTNVLCEKCSDSL